MMTIATLKGVRKANDVRERSHTSRYTLLQIEKYPRIHRVRLQAQQLKKACKHYDVK